MNKYLLLDYDTNTISSLNKINTFFEENEIQTSSCTCTDRADLLNMALEILKTEIEKEAEKQDIRVCTECGRLMDEGYIDADFHYYCSDKCLHRQYSEELWNYLHENFEDDYFWTEWR